MKFAAAPRSARSLQMATLLQLLTAKQIRGLSGAKAAANLS
jgi:hypothetical protein